MSFTAFSVVSDSNGTDQLPAIPGGAPESLRTNNSRLGRPAQRPEYMVGPAAVVSQAAVMQLLVFTWPYALVFWAVFLWAFTPEFSIVRRAEERLSPQDAHSKRVIEAGQGLAALAAFVIAATVPASLPHEQWYFGAGVLLVTAGSLLRRHCFRMLGTSFTGAVIVKADQAVVEQGAYRYVRHPSYTAGALLFVGVGMALANWLSLTVLLLSTALVYAYRVRVEETALVTVIGDPYRQYMSRTKRFIPFVF